MAAVSFRQVEKTFGPTTVIHGISFDIADGEFTVLVGQSTREATSGSIAYEAAGDHTLKGKASPVSAWRAVRVTGMVRGIGRSDVLEPPFTGRDAELRMIK